MKQIAIGLTLVNSAQAGKSLPEIEVVYTENQRWHFRQVTVNHTAAELTVFGQMDAHLLTRRASRKGGVGFSAKLPALPDDAAIQVAFRRDEPQQRQNPVHNQTVAR